MEAIIILAVLTPIVSLIIKVLIGWIGKVQLTYIESLKMTFISFILSYIVTQLTMYAFILSGNAQLIYVVPMYGIVLCIMSLFFLFQWSIKKTRQRTEQI